MKTADLECHVWDSRRLWSLWEMINFQLFGLCKVLEALQTTETDFRSRVAFVEAEVKYGNGYAALKNSQVPYEVYDTDRNHILGQLAAAEAQANDLGLVEVKNKVHRFKIRIQNNNVSISDVALEIKILRETFESDLYKTYFYAYPNDKAKVIRNVNADWSVVFNKFSDMEENITAAVDCYATGHNLGAVFYLMHVMEKAVQKFGKKFKVDLIKTHPTKRVSELSWEQIINELNPKLKSLPQGTVSQKRQYEKLTAVQAHLFAVKDAWRNPTMHPREQGYNDLEALNIICYVRAFLTEFSSMV